MSASNPTGRTSRFFVFLVMLALVAGGAWYTRTQGMWGDDQDLVDDDEDEPVSVTPDGGAKNARSKKKASPRGKKKASEPRQARATPAARPTPAVPMPTGPSGMSYETAIAGSNLELTPGTQDVPDLTNAQLAGPTHDGSFLDACGVPPSMHVTVKVAIRNGRAVGVSAYAVPPNKEIGWCVERHVRGLQWPSNAKMDSFVTTY